MEMRTPMGWEMWQSSRDPMPSIPGIDDGNTFDWGKTSADYSTWRPNYPECFYEGLKTFGVGLSSQRILDLGTGVGFLALRFAQAGAIVTGIDIAPEQIDEARQRCRSLGLTAEFQIVPAEDTGLVSSSFDVITASQSWHYFDKERAIPEVKRLLRPGGLFVTSHLVWLPRQDAIAKASEQLVLQHNPKWSHADHSGDVTLIPTWSIEHFAFHAMFVFDEAIPFTRESWRGRIRACRGIGASLTRGAVEDFDQEHDELLRRIAPDQFTVLHRIDMHLFRVKT
jgi:SAM-dependent methyltransferase